MGPYHANMRRRGTSWNYNLSRAALGGLLLAFAVGGCGVTAPSVSVLGADFHSKAVAVCEHALALKKAQGAFPFPDFNPTKPDIARFPAVADFLKLTDATFTTWDNEMVALGQPPTGSAVWADVVAAVHEHRVNNADQIVAATNGDAARFSKDYEIGVETAAAMLKAATAAGVPACSAVDH